MDIKELKIQELKPYENNPRDNGNAVEAVAASIREFGFKVPIVIDKDNVIIAGHTRLKAAQLLGLEKVPVIIADDLTPEQVKAFRVADNKTAELAEWDMELLEQELAELQMMDFDMEQFGFEAFDDEGEGEIYDDYVIGSLTDKYIFPPFSTLNARSGEWQERKRMWKKKIKSEFGRPDDLLGKGMIKLNNKMANNSGLRGTSAFDPVLCEILLTWFCPQGGKVIDPFAGGSVRGLISSYLGLEYYGTDLSEKQIKSNYDNYELVKNDMNLLGDELSKPNWVCSDSKYIDEVFADKQCDFLLTCPPYADLEVYSDNPDDLSNMDYDDFKSAYFDIIAKACSLLKENSFAAIVVGDVRDKKGYYRSFVPHTIEAFKAAGLEYYNEMILIDCVGNGHVRAGKYFGASRKVVKLHQNVLVFVKGNEKEIMKNIVPYEYDFSNIEHEVEDGE